MAVRMVSTSEPATADQKPWTAKPGVTRQASFNRKAFTTSRKSPSVKNVRGRVRNLSTGPMVALTMAITIVAMSAAPKSRTLIPGMICATSQSARALRNQLTMRCSIRTSGSEIMISHGDIVRGDIRFCLPCLEAGLLSGQAAGQSISETLRRTAQLRRDQLYVPALAGGHHASGMGGGDADGLRLRGEGAHAHHAHSAAEKRGAGDGTFSESHRPAADVEASGAGAVPVAAADEVRCGAAAELPEPAAEGNAVCVRIPARFVAGGRGVRRTAAEQRVAVRGGVGEAGSAGGNHRRLRVLPAAQTGVHGGRRGCVGGTRQGIAGHGAGFVSDVQARRVAGGGAERGVVVEEGGVARKSTRLNSSHL